MSVLKSILLVCVASVVAISWYILPSAACPFCSAASQTLRQEMTSMDVVGFATLVPSDQETIDGQATFQVNKVVRGDTLAKAGDTLIAPYFGPGKTDKEFLVMAVKSDELLWSSPLTLTEAPRKYVEEVFTLPEDNAQRLKFFYEYLDSQEPLLSGDAYDEFALAPYEDVKAVKEHFRKDELWSWLNDEAVSPDRKRLYYTLLGLVADKSDAVPLEKRLRSEDPNQRAGLDALIACYLTIIGDEGLPLIDELFLKNTKCPYGDTYAAIQALRFQGTDGGAIQRDGLLNSFRIMLDRPDYADLVIPDLARWEDWSQVDKLADLFVKADSSTNWIRVPVINYLRVCPLPEAKVKLKELELVDPKAFQRANTFFPLPPATGPSPTDSSRMSQPASGEQNDQFGKTNTTVFAQAAMLSLSESPVTEVSGIVSDTPSLIEFVHQKANGEPVLARVTAVRPSSSAIEIQKSPVNLLKIVAVTILTSINFALVLGLVLTGAPANASLILSFRQFLQRCIS